MARIPATAAPDVLNGTANQDSILGTRSDDLLRGRGGDNMLDFGPDSDELSDRGRNDTQPQLSSNGSNLATPVMQSQKFQELTIENLNVTTHSDGILPIVLLLWALSLGSVLILPTVILAHW